MAGSLKKGVVLLVVIFVVFYMFTDPNGLATIAKDGVTNGWALLQDLFRAVIRFVNAMAS